MNKVWFSPVMWGALSLTLVFVLTEVILRSTAVVEVSWALILALSFGGILVYTREFLKTSVKPYWEFKTDDLFIVAFWTFKTSLFFLAGSQLLWWVTGNQDWILMNVVRTFFVAMLAVSLALFLAAPALIHGRIPVSARLRLLGFAIAGGIIGGLIFRVQPSDRVISWVEWMKPYVSIIP